MSELARRLAREAAKATFNTCGTREEFVDALESVFAPVIEAGEGVAKAEAGYRFVHDMPSETEHMTPDVLGI